MSYKDTEAKLRKALDNLESTKADFFTEKAVAEKRYTENMNRMEELLKKLNTGNWRFVAKSPNNGYFFAEARYLDDNVIRADSPRYDAISAPVGVSLENIKGDGDTSVIKQHIVASMLNCISRSFILRLDLFADTVLKPAELIEHKITQDMCDEIYDILSESDDDRTNLFDMWYESDTAETVLKLEALVDQASREWVEEGNLKVGMDFFTPLGSSKITSITIAPNPAITTEDGNNYTFFGRTNLAIKYTWKAYHPELRVDERLDPLDTMGI